MEFQKIFSFDFDEGSSEFYLNCFDTDFHKELQNHPDKILIEFSIQDDTDNNGCIYCYTVSNGYCQKDCKYNYNLDIVVEILRKHGFKQYKEDSFIF